MNFGENRILQRQAYETSDYQFAAENLAYSYGEIEVFSNVSFSLSQGELAVLVGENGSGKSTLLRCLAGWARPTRGQVLLGNAPFDTSSRIMRKEVAFVPDSPVFYDDMTANEHLAFICQANQITQENEYSAELMSRLGLFRFKNRLPGTFSRGMKVKMGIILALALSPKVLLFDEPYGPLDPKARRVLSGIIREQLNNGSAIIVSCHHEIPDLKPDLILQMGIKECSSGD